MIDVTKLIETGRQLNAVLPLEGGEPVAIVPNGYSLTGLGKFLPPAFTSQRISLSEAKSFIEYVNRFKTASTAVFATVTDIGASFCAVIDYHEVNQPRRVSHIATFSCHATQEWTAWVGSDRKEMSQEQFALFLESNERVFRAPNGAELLELITTLEGKSQVNFTSGIRLTNGASRLNFEEDVDLRGGQGTGQIEIPNTFELAIAPFQGEAPYSIRARLRYKINSRKLAFHYETITPHLIIRDAARLVVERVENETEITILMGTLL